MYTDMKAHLARSESSFTSTPGLFDSGTLRLPANKIQRLRGAAGSPADDYQPAAKAPWPAIQQLSAKAHPDDSDARTRL